MMTLALRGHLDATLQELCRPLAQRAFGVGICPVDGVYATNWISQDTTDANGHDVKDGFVRFNIQRAADLSHSFYVVVELDDGLCVEDAFSWFELSFPPDTVEKRSLSKTLAMAKARGLYPAFTNRRCPAPAPAKRTAYIPLLLQSPPTVPFIASHYQPMIIVFGGCRCKTITVEYEGVYLDSAARQATFNLDYRKPIDWKEVRPTQIPAHVLERGSEEETFDINSDCIYHHERLSTSSQATALILSLHFDHPIDADEHPLQSATLLINCQSAYSFDAPMLEEINWQRCGLIPPTDSYKFREKRQDFLYLMPFSREAFSADPPTTWICFDRFNNAALRLRLAREGYGIIQGVISIQTLNVRCLIQQCADSAVAPRCDDLQRGCLVFATGMSRSMFPDMTLWASKSVNQ